MVSAAILLAAGEGRRLGGADKALLDLGGRTACAWLVAALRGAGVERIVVVRAPGAAPLPVELGVEVAMTSGNGDMLASLRVGQAAVAGRAKNVFVSPVDHALVTADTLIALECALDAGAGIALPLYRDQPGHPLALRAGVLEEIGEAVGSLREVVRREPGRVRVVATANPWVVRDLDTPERVAQARAWLAYGGMSVAEVMRAHRSRRSFLEQPVAGEQVARLVDAARHTSTPGFIQAAAVVAVHDPQRRGEVADLCGGQQHIREAPWFLAVCADMARVASACGQHGTVFQSEGLEVFVQGTLDAALFGQNLLLAAEAEGLGGCMIGAARNHPDKLARLLGLPEHCYVVFGIVLGHPADDPVPRMRMPLDGVLHLEQYSAEAAAAAVRTADDQMREWARQVNETGAGRQVDESKGWTERMAQQWGEGSRYAEERRDLLLELRRRGFGLECP